MWEIAWYIEQSIEKSFHDFAGNYELQVISAPRGSGQRGADSSDDYAGSTDTSGIDMRESPSSNGAEVNAPLSTKKKRTKHKSSLPSLSSIPSADTSDEDEGGQSSGTDTSKKRFLNPQYSVPDTRDGGKPYLRTAKSEASLGTLSVNLRRPSNNSMDANSSYSVNEEWMQEEFYGSSSTETGKRLPVSCFRRTFPKAAEDDVIPGYSILKQELQQITVLSSTGFFRDFNQRTFNVVLDKLGVSQDMLEYRRVQPPTIRYCCVDDGARVDIMCTPTIQVPFVPDEVMVEWRLRDRKTKWPPEDILGSVNSYGCNLVPNKGVRMQGDKIVNHWDVR
jgi:hypothetical protein